MLYMELLYREANKNGEINNDEIKNDDNIKEDIVWKRNYLQQDL